MLKGINKNVIVIHPSPKSRFDTVYFVLKSSPHHASEDLIREANKRIKDGEYSSPKKHKKPYFYYIFGLICGAFLSAITVLIFIAPKL